MKLAVFASGNGSNFEAIVKGIRETNFAEIVLLITDRKCFAIDRAVILGIPVYAIDRSKQKKEYELEIMKELYDFKVDFIALAGYMNIIGDTLLSAYPNRIVNIHPSLLPKYKGLNAIERAVINRDESIGVTIHYVDKGIDTGKIISQDSITYSGESVFEITRKIHELEHKLYIKTLKGLLR